MPRKCADALLEVVGGVAGGLGDLCETQKEVDGAGRFRSTALHTLPG